MAPSGEVFSFPEGRLHLWPSASGSNSGSAIAFVVKATLRFQHGWLELPNADKTYTRVETGRRADLTIEHMYAYRSMYALADASAAVNAKFEGLVGGGAAAQSAVYALYSGAIDVASITQADGDVFQGSLTMHATEWSAFGQT